jgi:hypothetical protein
MVALHQDLTRRVESLSDGVNPGYRHYQKHVEPRAALETDGFAFKWYDIGFAERPLSPELHDEARNLLVNEIASEAIESTGQTGFVLLHDCGDVVFLLISTWCGNNELWESVYVKRPELGGSFRPLRVPGDHRPTFCVWEMAAVAHEARAWSRYLVTERSPHDVRAYFADQLRGVV